ncbi:MAG: GTPase Era [Actinobacteria bacterium]|nr:GTPase Era [Actinomycetota bacterium]
MTFKSGFISFVGRPNVGKSTLTNALVGQKIAIVSDRPQTTRRLIRGIVHRSSGQIVVLDTPGMHKPKTLLGERLIDLVIASLSEVDAVGICFPATESIGTGDKFILQQVLNVNKNVFLVITKTDAANPSQIAERITDAMALENEFQFSWRFVVPVSPIDGTNINELESEIIDILPEGPALYPDGQLTDQPERELVAELIREAALQDLREELPHSVTVLVEEMNLREGREDARPLMDIFADIHVERDSQKAIVIGKHGAQLRAIGTQARLRIEKLLEMRVHLNLHVRVSPNWQSDPKYLGKLGF